MSDNRWFDGVPYIVDPPRDVEGFQVRDCMRSGLCCKTATCSIGVSRGAPSKGCTFLRGDKPGEYRCGIVEDEPEMSEVIGVGWGCCMPLFNNDRAAVLRERRKRSSRTKK